MKEFVIDLNCDMGESFGAYQIGNDSEIIRYITSANIACGFHASDPTVMAETVSLCRRYKVMPGAHPGYRDIVGFGRRQMEMDQKDLINDIAYQVGALTGFLNLCGLKLQHVKFHGALYNFMVNQEARFLEIAAAIKDAFGNPALLALGTNRTASLKKICRKKGLRLALEAFPDRMYTDDGELLSRSHRQAVLHDPNVIARRAVTMVKEQGIESVNGRWIDMDIDTLCLHGDNVESVVAAKKIHGLFKKEKILTRPLAVTA